MNRLNVTIGIFLLACLGNGIAAANDTVLVHDAWIAEGPPTVKTHAGYLDIENSGHTDVTLYEITSPDFERIEIHHSIIDDGIAKMLYQRSITIPAGSRLSFAPGTYHIMLFNARKPLLEGETIPLTFIFKDDSVIHIEAKIKKLQNAPHLH